MKHHLICTAYYANTGIMVSLLIYATICVVLIRYPIFGICFCIGALFDLQQGEQRHKLDSMEFIWMLIKSFEWQTKALFQSSKNKTMILFMVEKALNSVSGGSLVWKERMNCWSVWDRNIHSTHWFCNKRIKKSDGFFNIELLKQKTKTRLTYNCTHLKNRNL